MEISSASDIFSFQLNISWSILFYSWRYVMEHSFCLNIILSEILSLASQVAAVVISFFKNMSKSKQELRQTKLRPREYRIPTDNKLCQEFWKEQPQVWYNSLELAQT